MSTSLIRVLPYLSSKSSLTKEEIKQQFPDLESGDVDMAFWIWQTVDANKNKSAGKSG